MSLALDFTAHFSLNWNFNMRRHAAAAAADNSDDTTTATDMNKCSLTMIQYDQTTTTPTLINMKMEALEISTQTNTRTHQKGSYLIRSILPYANASFFYLLCDLHLPLLFVDNYFTRYILCLSIVSFFAWYCIENAGNFDFNMQTAHTSAVVHTCRCHCCCC